MTASRKFTTLFLLTILMTSLLGCASTATKEGTGGYVDDSVVTTKVKAVLLHTAGIDSTEISVETFKGVVKLSGFLDSQKMIDAAVQAAKTVSGVISVTNNLTVKGQQSTD